MGTRGGWERPRSGGARSGRTRAPAGPSAPNPIRHDLVVRELGEALRFYERAFGASEQGPLPGRKGRAATLEIAVGDLTLVLWAQAGGPRRLPSALRKGQRRRLHLRVQDCDASTGDAWESGARVLKTPHETLRGERAATVRDPFGLIWHLSAPSRLARAGGLKSMPRSAASGGAKS
jgi:PhnB protein